MALFTEPPRAVSYADLFRHILEAVASEYGRELLLTEETEWLNVPRETRAAISSVTLSAV
jgi:hypothetical protein